MSGSPIRARARRRRRRRWSSTTRRSTCSAQAAFEALDACLDEVEGSRRPGARLARRGRGVHAAAPTSTCFQQIVDAGGDRSDVSFEPLLGAVRRLEALPIPTLALVHGLCLTAGLEVSLGCDMIWAARVGPLRPGRGGGRADARRRRHPADGRARGPGARPRVRDVPGHLRRRDAGALERGQPGAARRRAAREGDAVRAAAGGRPDQGARGDQADRPRLPARAGSTRPTRSTPEVAGALFETEDLQRAVKSFLAEGPGKATFEGR